LFKNTPGIHLSIFPTAFATLLAIILGLFIPLLSSIIPIKIALSKNLTESLNANRPKSKGVIVTSLDENSNTGSYLVFGSICVLAGISIYYLLPVAVLN
jgi:hypothetical protein